MNAKVLITSLILLSALNVYLITYIYGNQNELIECKYNSTISNYRANSYLASNKILNNQDVINKYTNYISNEMKGNNPIMYLLFTTNEDCTNCITDTISELQVIEEELIDKIHIYYTEVNPDSYRFSNFFNQYNYKFSSADVDFINDFNSISIIQFPIFVIFDNKRNLVLEAFQPEPGNTESLSAFINRVNNLITLSSDEK